jgi:alpha-L-fucosidase
MFIHWGLYSGGELDCWMMHDMGVPPDEYAARLLPRFTASRYNPDSWMRMAKSAGCKYVILGTRHHEGYCLWNTATTKFNAVATTPGRDLIAPFVKAARRAGLRVGLYYSLFDWRDRSYWVGPRRDPDGWDRMVGVTHAQVRELLSNYGRIDILWFDGAWPDLSGRWGFQPDRNDLAKAWQGRKLIRMARRLQPAILVNDRAGVAAEFGTPEQSMDWIDATLQGESRRPWELCDTLGDLWGYAPVDRNRKSAREILLRLVTCASRDGNFLLNVGPRPDGSVPAWQTRKMSQIGAWTRRHAGSIYGCEGEWHRPFTTGLAPWRVTRKGRRLFLHLFRYPGSRPFSIARHHPYHLVRARLLDTQKALRIERDSGRDILHGLPATAPDPIAPVVELTVRPGARKDMPL